MRIFLYFFLVGKMLVGIDKLLILHGFVGLFFCSLLEKNGFERDSKFG